MEPTLSSLQNYRYTHVQNSDHLSRGTIVVYTHEDYLTVSRIVGLPHESLRIQDSQVYIDGEVVPEPYVTPDKTQRGNREEISIPAENYALMVDNRALNPAGVALVTMEEIVGIIEKF